VTDDMIERVMNALRNTLWQHGTQLTRSINEELARAVLQEMRKPTKAMLEAGPPFPYMDEYVWAKMIDTALEEKP